MFQMYTASAGQSEAADVFFAEVDKLSEMRRFQNLVTNELTIIQQIKEILSDDQNSANVAKLLGLLSKLMKDPDFNDEFIDRNTLPVLMSKLGLSSASPEDKAISQEVGRSIL